MKNAAAPLRTHPEAIEKSDARSELLEALANCEKVCQSCADACSSEVQAEKLRDCILLALDCGAVCRLTAKLVVNQKESSPALVHAQLHACGVACQKCADLCATHSGYDLYCGICAHACRDCGEKCSGLLLELSVAGVGGFESTA